MWRWYYYDHDTCGINTVTAMIHVALVLLQPHLDACGIGTVTAIIHEALILLQPRLDAYGLGIVTATP